MYGGLNIVDNYESALSCLNVKHLRGHSSAQQGLLEGQWERLPVVWCISTMTS